MPFTGNFTCNSFKSGLIDGDFDFDTDTFKIALYTNSRIALTAETAAFTRQAARSLVQATRLVGIP
jgi:hypothetical protein